MARQRKAESALVPDLTVSFDAQRLTTAWLTARLASGEDAELVSLFRTVMVELYDEGARLYATDGQLAVLTWAPNAKHRDERPPEPDVAPTETFVVMDQENRGRDLLSFLHRRAVGKGAIPFEVDVSVAKDPASESPTFDGLERRTVIIEHPDHERVLLPVYDGLLPPWRPLLERQVVKATRELHLAPDLLARLAKFGKYQDGKLHAELSGAGQPLCFSFWSDVAPVVGLAAIGGEL